MDPVKEDEMTFEEFLTARLRDKGMSLKKLSEATGIAPPHLENLFHGNFEEMPSMPYFRGYIMRIAKVLEFDGAVWWAKLKKEDFVKNSGPADALPENRFVKKAIPKSWWVVGAAAILLALYGIITFPRITGKPSLILTAPNENPFVTTSTTMTVRGVVTNADVLTLSNGDASSSENVAIAPDGSWQEDVLLQDGVNSFEITAKKFLGGATSMTEEIISEAPTAITASSSASTSPPAAAGSPSPLQ
jgi:cytoskeletal protein RodZ